jgi:hypothetical protein
VYADVIHWNGLTDGETKYVYWAMDGQEQLFNITPAADPYEYTNHVNDSAYAGVLATWRSRMVQQFEVEGRGPTWVKAGALVPRPGSQLFSYNYPNITA